MESHKKESRKSAVRVYVTYVSIGSYLSLSAITVIWLLYLKKFEMAIAVLGAVGSMAGSITGFWFGARQPQTSNEAMGRDQSNTKAANNADEDRAD